MTVWGPELAERYTAIFQKYDINEDGVIDREEYALFLERIAKGKDVPKGVRRRGVT
jgi:Ca2+-binding EF-hand superfamily protein